MIIERHSSGRHLNLGGCLAAGFFDQSHLTRYFKRILGMTPGAYKTAIRSKTIKTPRT
jgi:methylphosphotriester-DNA--protein-cysteine methyltransferase